MTNAVDPTGADLKRFLAEDDGGEVVMLNLLKMAEGGAASYRDYARAIEPFLDKVGGSLVYAGTLGLALVAPDSHDWDAVLLVRYPSRAAFSQMVANVDQAVLGKQHVTRLALTCMLSEGHLLLEDFPGTGKTQLARAMAGTVQGSNSRIQFTPDLLPSDVTGVTIFDPS